MNLTIKIINTVRLHINFIYFLLLLLFSSCKKESTQDSSLNNEFANGDPLIQVNISTNGVQILDEPKIDAKMTISFKDEELHSENIAIEIRGKSSQMFPKKQYGFETRDQENEDMDVSLLDMPEEEDWILQAPYSDKSLIRNVLIYDLSREIGRYASRVKFVELTLNDVNDGVYVFMEKLKRDKNRIDINKLKTSEISGEDLTGGYIIKIDKPDDQYTSLNSFVSEHSPYDPSGNNSIKFLYDTPDEEDITPEQKEYISNYVKDFENTLAGENFTDPIQGYDSHIDTDDFIDFFLLNELGNNVDGFRISTWIVKDKNEKMRMGPIWDFNLAFGNADYCSGGESNVWAYKLNQRCPGGFWPIPFWWERLLQDPAYVLKVKARWTELRGTAFSNSAITKMIDNYELVLISSGSVKRNFERWPVLGTYVWPNNFIGSDYSDEIKFIRNWISERLSWLDSNIASL